MGTVFSTWRNRRAMDASLLFQASPGSAEDAFSYNWNVAYRIHPAGKAVNELLGQVEVNGIAGEGGESALFAALSLQRILENGSLLIFFAHRFRITESTGFKGAGPSRLWTLGFMKIIY